MDTSKALEILGLVGDPSPTAIKKAYREQVKLWHPDRYSAESAMKTLAEKNVQEANLAYAFLKHRMPGSPKGATPHASKTMRQTNSRSPSPALSRRQNSFIQLMTALRRSLPKGMLDQVLKWLQHDTRKPFRPWYRYPNAHGSQEGRAGKSDFDHVLQNAMRNHAALKRIHRTRRRSSNRAGEDQVAPVEAVAKPRKSTRSPFSDEG